MRFIQTTYISGILDLMKVHSFHLPSYHWSIVNPRAIKIELSLTSNGHYNSNTGECSSVSNHMATPLPCTIVWTQQECLVRSTIIKTLYALANRLSSLYTLSLPITIHFHKDMENYSNGGWKLGFELISNYFSQERLSHLDTTNDNLVVAGSSDTSDGVVLTWELRIIETQYLY